MVRILRSLSAWGHLSPSRKTRHNTRLRAREAPPSEGSVRARKMRSAAVNITIEISDVTLGVIEAEEVRVTSASAKLAEEMDAACEQLRRERSLEQVAEMPSVRAVRAMFRAWGVDPVRYRPSSEALLRRVVQGKGLYRVSNVVDLNNLGSIETAWPYGTYDRATLAPPVALRLGLTGEKYEGIGKQTWHLAGRPVLVDGQGPFGSPISDSMRTRITEATAAVLTVVFAPASSAAGALDQALERHARRLERYAGARVRATAVLIV